jgi:hypothetical protein
MKYESNVFLKKQIILHNLTNVFPSSIDNVKQKQKAYRIEPGNVREVWIIIK